MNSNTKRKKQTGLGAASYFDDVTTLEGSVAKEEEIENTTISSKANSTPLPEKKIRRTYAVSAETQLALETMKLEARKQGEAVTLGDLLEEAVQLLVRKKGVTV